MVSETSEYASILERLTRVEQENRKLKRAGLIFLLVVAASLLSGQTLPTKVVEASEFVLKDAHGKVRARLGMGATRMPSALTTDLASLELFDSAATPIVRLMATPQQDGFLSLGRSSPDSPAIVMDVNEKGAGLGFNAGPASARRTMILNADAAETSILLGSSSGKRRGIGLTDGDPAKSPSIVVFDDEGFESQLGVTQTTIIASGQKRKTSAASLIFLGKDGNVIWSAP